MVADATKSNESKAIGTEVKKINSKNFFTAN